MKIVRLEIREVDLRLATPYTIAYDQIEKVENVFLQLVTDGRYTGLGCAAPDPEVTGESTPSVVRDLERIEPLLVGRDALRRSPLLEELRRELPSSPAARAAVDMALWDLLGKVADLPLWRILGGYRDRIATSVTIGILPIEETVEQGRELWSRGFRCLKIKGGLDPEEDAQRVLELRAALGKRATLRFDANQGYDLKRARRFLDLAGPAGLEILEQPTPSREPELMGALRRADGVPVMADESLVGLRDAFRLARNRLVDMVNVKLMKVGGLDGALHVVSVARAARLPAMVGCMDESELGIAAGLALALARPQVRYADLDGHLDLLGDPAAGNLRLEGGVLFGPSAPGLGVSLEDDRGL